MKPLYQTMTFILLAISTHATSNTLITWDALVPPAQQIELPELNQQQVIQLFAVLKHQQNSLKSPLSQKEQQDLDLNKELLSQSGHDADTLLQLRENARALEQKRLVSINPDLNLKDVTIPGYVIPLENNGTLTTKFLLIPIAGSCSHSPAPPKNQTIIVDIEHGFALQDLYKVITVSGDINVHQQDMPIPFTDGTKVISTGYAMSATTVNYIK